MCIIGLVSEWRPSRLVYTTATLYSFPAFSHESIHHADSPAEWVVPVVAVEDSTSLYGMRLQCAVIQRRVLYLRSRLINPP